MLVVQCGITLASRPDESAFRSGDNRGMTMVNGNPSAISRTNLSFWNVTGMLANLFFLRPGSQLEGVKLDGLQNGFLS